MLSVTTPNAFSPSYFGQLLTLTETLSYRDLWILFDMSNKNSYDVANQINFGTQKGEAQLGPRQT